MYRGVARFGEDKGSASPGLVFCAIWYLSKGSSAVFLGWFCCCELMVRVPVCVLMVYVGR